MPQPKKRSLEEAESFLEGVKVLLLDIEGTITPINFVKVITTSISFSKKGLCIHYKVDARSTQRDKGTFY